MDGDILNRSLKVVISRRNEVVQVETFEVKHRDNSRRSELSQSSQSEGLSCLDEIITVIEEREFLQRDIKVLDIQRRRRRVVLDRHVELAFQEEDSQKVIFRRHTHLQLDTDCS